MSATTAEPEAPKPLIGTALHNALMGPLMTLIIDPIAVAGGDNCAVMYLLESLMVAVILQTIPDEHRDRCVRMLAECTQRRINGFRLATMPQGPVQ